MLMSRKTNGTGGTVQDCLLVIAPVGWGPWEHFKLPGAWAWNDLLLGRAVLPGSWAWDDLLRGIFDLMI